MKYPDAELTKTICAYVRGGAFQWVAAVASGVSKGKFYEWMRGESLEEREFQHAVNQAHAQCRVTVEVDVAKRKGLDWLLAGPGRERPGEPGWSKQTAVTGPDGGALQTVTNAAPALDLSKLTDEELKQLNELEKKALGTGGTGGTGGAA